MKGIGKKRWEVLGHLLFTSPGTTLPLCFVKIHDLWVLSLFSIKCCTGPPGGSDGTASACSEGDPGLIPGLGRSPLEKEMATHSSTLAWKIPRTKEPGRLQSMGSQRVGHDWATSHTYITESGNPKMAFRYLFFGKLCFSKWAPRSFLFPQTSFALVLTNTCQASTDWVLLYLQFNRKPQRR